ncbi:hypothetical protein TWF569_010720 [Orbilia oligospora]|uniref:N-acetyltransferase domain-containing protein n=3 Tax=Orbilia oligospora TaxID=2813651 RepID=G1XC78_ARTOA|nr:hypothetical protein AOL_s00078g525 [Orbilia oligospora ATCC 24927]KAF3103524.1 hypothetical protein TWF102_003710 [Orbilia oligospora]EGX49492.1 hypothetical protein AOL_s00078g525 [Orbilia oligospora ATCC 24927]KAF3105218.1 hypothetical protein TWF103_006679 [Orbilia oligospora]KAF3106148.1 hypothetical protein TWF706_003531 [Orbilia oligospora]KAF3133022.1 hypothetical protein TWF569_010720 [Orbilia oligospora]
MKLREASPRDLPQIMEVLLEGLVDDPMFDWTWRYRHQYPWDNYYYWSLRINSMINNAGVVFLVVELDEADKFRDKGDPIGTLVSFVVWKRTGEDEHAKRRRSLKAGILNMLDRTVNTLQDYSMTQHYPEGRRDADYRRWAVLKKGVKAVDATYFTRYQNFWELELLATHRKYRRHGAATMLVEWGIRLADEEGVPCCVISSPMGKPVYENSGFVLASEEKWVFQVKGEEEKVECFVLIRSSKNERVLSAETGDGYMIVSSL